MDQLRQSFIQKVLDNRLTPDRADAACRDMGLGPLLADPDPSDYDPFKEPFWSLTMTLAWVAWREAPAVQVSWERYCAAHRVWVQIEGQNGKPEWRLGQHSTVPAITLLARDLVTMKPIASLPPPLFEIEEAWQALRLALSSTELKAFAFSVADGRERWIEAPEWMLLYPGKIEEKQGGHITSITETVDRSGEPAYRDIRIPLGSVLDAWPIEGREPSPEAPAKAGNFRAGGLNAKEARKARTAAAEWLVSEYMDRSPAQQTHTKDELYPIALERFGRYLSERSFKRDAWADAVNSGPFSAWSVGGTPPSRKH